MMKAISATFLVADSSLPRISCAGRRYADSAARHYATPRLLPRHYSFAVLPRRLGLRGAGLKANINGRL